MNGERVTDLRSGEEVDKGLAVALRLHHHILPFALLHLESYFAFHKIKKIKIDFVQFED